MFSVNNYEYIIASLPVLVRGTGSGLSATDADGILKEVRSLLEGRDTDLLDLILGSYEGDGPDEAFYRSMASCRNAFARNYFAYDLDVRNAKTAYLNAALGRPDGTDEVHLSDGEFEDRAAVDAVLADTDLLSRERGLDNLMWDKAEELVQFHVFDLDVILSFVVRLKITDRWLQLDEETGREFFRKLVNEIRNNR